MKMSHNQIIIYLDCDFRQGVEGCEDLRNQARRSRNNLRPVVAFYFHPKINKIIKHHQESEKKLAPQIGRIQTLFRWIIKILESIGIKFESNH